MIRLPICQKKQKNGQSLSDFPTMPDKIYRYSSLFRKAEYSLTDEGVAITSTKFSRFTKTFVPFDHISIRSTTDTWSSKPAAWAAILFAVLFLVILVDLFFDAHPEPVGLLLYGSLSLVFAAFYAATRVTSEVFSYRDDHISFFRRKAYDPTLDDFIKELHERKILFFKQRIERRAEEVPSDEIVRYLLSLRESELIDDKGYTTLRAEVEKIYEDRPFLGFSQSD